MILSETKYTEQDYDGLVDQLLQSPEAIDDELQFHPQPILTLNPSFYLQMFRAVAKKKENATSNNDFELVSALNYFEGKLYEYTNIIPADLPDSILRDRNLINNYLTNDRTIYSNEKDWRDYQFYIREKSTSIPKNLKIPLLEWFVKMLKMNWERHKEVCERQGDCGIDIGYDKRLLFFSKMIEDATPQQFKPLFINTPKPGNILRSLNKIQWLGSQKELAELFVELKKKGWIEKFEYDTIQECFTESNSIPQYLKPATDKKTKEDTHEKLYAGYVPQFYGLKENPKRRK
jgi:hypothetical protein